MKAADSVATAREYEFPNDAFIMAYTVFQDFPSIRMVLLLEHAEDLSFTLGLTAPPWLRTVELLLDSELLAKVNYLTEEYVGVLHGDGFDNYPSGLIILPANAAWLPSRVQLGVETRKHDQMIENVIRSSQKL